ATRYRLRPVQSAWCGLSDRQDRHEDDLQGRRLPQYLAALCANARAANMAMVDLLKRIAERKQATPAQIALAWLLEQKPWIGPIPGTTNVNRVEQNIGSASVELTPQGLDEINTAAPRSRFRASASLNQCCECLTAKVPVH